MLTRRALLAATTGLAVTRLAAPAIAQQPTIKVGSILGANTVAAELLPDLLAPKGIKVEIVNFPNITQRMQAVASGDIQVGYGGINAAILLAANGVKLALAANAAEGGWNTVALPSIGGWNDLKGKKMAVQVGSTADLCLRWKLKERGLANDVEVLNMNNNDMPTALSRGDIQAAMPFEPAAAFATVRGFAKEFWRPYDTPMKAISLGLIVSPAYAAANKSLTKELVAAHVAATAKLKSDPSAPIDTMMKVLNVPRDVAEAAMKNIVFTHESGASFAADVRALGGMMLEAGLVKQLPDWSGFIDTSLVA